MIIATSPPIEMPLELLSVKQKWQLVQALCDDLAGDPDGELDMPEWHLGVLQDREKRIAAGEATWISQEVALRSLESKHA